MAADNALKTKPGLVFMPTDAIHAEKERRDLPEQIGA